MSTETVTSQRMQLPASKFYWGVLDISILPKRTRYAATQLDYLLEPLLPVPLGHIHRVYHPLDENHILACGIDHQTLKSGVPPDALTLTPESLPVCIDWVTKERPDLEKLNLLTAEWTPVPLRKAHKRTLAYIIVAVIICAFVITLGVERRIFAHNKATDTLANSIQSTQENILGPSSIQTSQPLDILMLAELRRLQQTRGTNNLDGIQLESAVDTLETLLSNWPTDVHLTIETITITSTAITIRADVPTTEVEAVTSAIGPFGSWNRRQPEISNNAGVSSLTLQFARSQEDTTP